MAKFTAKPSPRKSSSRTWLISALVATIGLGAGYGGYQIFSRGDSEDGYSSAKKSLGGSSKVSAQPEVAVRPKEDEGLGLKDTAQKWLERAGGQKDTSESQPIRTPITNFSGAKSPSSSHASSSAANHTGAKKKSGLKKTSFKGHKKSKYGKKSKKAKANKKASHKKSKYSKKSKHSSKKLAKLKNKNKKTSKKHKLAVHKSKKSKSVHKANH